MQFTVNEKGSPAFYRELINVISQYRSLLKNPEKKLRNNYGLMRWELVFCAVFALLFLALGIGSGFDGLDIAAIAVLLLCGLISGVYYYNMRKMVNTYLADERPSVVTLDENGVELNKGDSQTVRLAWDNVGFVRVFKESICFVAKDLTGFVVALQAKYKDDIFGYIRDNGIDVRVIDA